MGCLEATLTRIGGAEADARRVGGDLAVTATRVGGMTAWLGLVCGPALIPPYLRVADGGYVLTVDDGYIILNEPYNDLNDGD